MKKVIALALALTLALSMASVALAADYNYTLTGSGQNDRLYPGEKYTLLDSGEQLGGSGPAITKGDYSVKADWKIGGAMVSSVKFNSDGDLILELNKNYTISDAKKLEGTITFTSKDGSKTKHTMGIVATVGNDLIEIDGYGKAKDAKDVPETALNHTIYKCTDAGYLAFNSDTRLFSVLLKMAKDEKAYLYNDEKMIDEVEDKYGHLDAEINCYTFGGRPTFKNAAEFSLQADYADQYYVYEWDGKKLTKQDYKWNSIDGVYEWSTKSPKAYVISDKELVAADEDEEGEPDTGKNPDTGANDVVGVAAALAVVSLVAAGAVSLKK